MTRVLWSAGSKHFHKTSMYFKSKDLNQKKISRSSDVVLFAFCEIVRFVRYFQVNKRAVLWKFLLHSGFIFGTVANLAVAGSECMTSCQIGLFAHTHPLSVGNTGALLVLKLMQLFASGCYDRAFYGKTLQLDEKMIRISLP